MSGHSKWATIKHKKGAADKARGKLWAKLVRNVEVAAREGGGDPSANATLRTMIDKAKAEQVPKDKIENAIKRGTGELKADTAMEYITYEGYAPGGVAVLVEVETDNRNRSGGDVRAAFSKHGGSIAEPGAVAWQFARRGVIVVPKTYGGGGKVAAKTISEDDLMLVVLDAGAEDLIDNGDSFELQCAPNTIGAVCSALVDASIPFDSADRPMVANITVPVGEEAEARRILKLIEVLEDLDDVNDVYANFDISDDLFATLSA
jgi:YebC/PmpR family DNA-binding regulatory protein